MAEKMLNIPLIKQEKTNWCYAAVIQMIIQHYNPGIEIPQCDIVSNISLIFGSYFHLLLISTPS